MLKGKRILGIIPARGGSKGIPYKNIKEVGGKPLIAWTIEEAKKSKYIDRLILSSEDSEIIKIAKEWGCEVPFIRPVELAKDDTPGVNTVLHALSIFPDFDIVVLLQPTSPLRKHNDIDACLEHFIVCNANSCISIVEANKSPYWMYTQEKNQKLKPILEKTKTPDRRQDLPKVYSINGALYIANASWLLQHKTFLTEETIGFEMPKERSLDIDDKFDLALLKTLLVENNYETIQISQSNFID